MNAEHKSPDALVPTLTPAETYPDHVPLPLGDGRCMYRFPSGPRCRRSASQIHPYLCDSHLHHAAELDDGASALPSRDRAPAGHPEPSSPYDPALARELLKAAGELTTARDVNRILRAVYRATVKRRISAKEAGTLCYIAQTLLNGQRTVSFLKKTAAQAAEAREKSRPFHIINDLPMATRD